MKSFIAYIFAIIFFMQHSAAFSADYVDFDSYCQTLRQSELELIEKEVEEGVLTKAEAEEEIAYYLPKVEQCVCYFQRVLEGTSKEFTLYLQKDFETDLEAEFEPEIPLEVELKLFAENEEYYKEEIEEFEMLKLTYPEGLDIVTFLEDSEKACGLDSE